VLIQLHTINNKVVNIEDDGTNTYLIGASTGASSSSNRANDNAAKHTHSQHGTGVLILFII
jgi:hypothetical protein